MQPQTPASRTANTMRDKHHSIRNSTQLITPGRLCTITKQADFVMYSSPICLYTVDPKCCGVQASCGLLHEVWLHADYACIAIWLVWIDSIVMHLRSIAFHSPLHQKTCASALGVTQAAMDTDWVQLESCMTPWSWWHDRMTFVRELQTLAWKGSCMQYYRCLMSTIRPWATQMDTWLMLLMPYDMYDSTSRAFWCFWCSK